ncbi:Gldg family protein [Chloroflexota bacterium]
MQRRRQRKRTVPEPTYFRLSGLIAVLGLVAMLIGLVIMVLLPGIRFAALAMLALGVILLAAAFIIDFRRVGSAIAGRRGRFNTGTTVMVSVFVGITLLVNAISIGSYKRFDTTGLSQFTLTSQTQDVLRNLDKPVEATYLYDPGYDPFSVNAYAEFLLEEYQNYTDKLTVTKVDSAENPDVAREYGTTQIPVDYRSPIIVFESEAGSRMVFSPEMYIQAENSFTSAVLEVTGTVQRRVYFLTGHGEVDLYSEYTQVRQSLLDYLFKVAPLQLDNVADIPEDCAALVIAAPQEPMTSNEISILENYLENSGKMLVLLNPDSPDDIKQMLAAWGVMIEDGTVIDPSSYVAPNKSAALITGDRNAFSLTEIYFPGAAAIVPAEEIGENIYIEPLAVTSEESWLERDYDPQEEPEFNEGVDVKGSLALAVDIYTVSPEALGKEELSFEDIETDILVVGDSDFASDQHFANGNNGGLFMNLIGQLTAGAEIISIERKVLPYRRLIVNKQQTNFITISSIGLLPFIVLVVGGVIWWRRR